MPFASCIIIIIGSSSAVVEPVIKACCSDRPCTELDASRTVIVIIEVEQEERERHYSIIIKRHRLSR